MPATHSGGVAALDEARETIRQALARAGGALYRARQNGRDRVEIANDPG